VQRVSAMLPTPSYIMRVAFYTIICLQVVRLPSHLTAVTAHCIRANLIATHVKYVFTSTALLPWFVMSLFCPI
jgi:hypothetical protein